MKIITRLSLCLVLSIVLLHAKAPGDFPRLLGMNIGKKNYDDPAYQARLARLDVVILGFPSDWNPRHGTDPIGHVLRNLKHLNPAIKIGQYTILNEAYDHRSFPADDDIHSEIEKNNWWLRNAKGQQVQWTAQYRTWEVNFSKWAKPNAEGQRYPEWLANRENNIFFQPHPEFDIWYCDNVMYRSRVTADWDHDGKDDDPKDPRIQAAFRTGMAQYWADIRALQPRLIIMGNADDDLSQAEYRKKLDASFMEGWMGTSWSRKTWSAAMEFYRATLSNLPAGAIVGVNIQGPVNDYHFMRYALTSCLLDDGYFNYTDKAVEYSSVPLFDEYDVPLGRAISPPPLAPWQSGVWRRDFAGGVALVNPTTAPATVTLEPGLHRFLGKQDPEINNGQPVHELTLASRDGIILVRDR